MPSSTSYFIYNHNHTFNKTLLHHRTSSNSSSEDCYPQYHSILPPITALHPPHQHSPCPTPSSSLNMQSSHSPKALTSSTLRPLLAHMRSEPNHHLIIVPPMLMTISRLMHQHTMQQLEAAARSASRRGSSAPSHQGSLSSESSLESESSDL